jgi:N-acetylmuramoyl-L-alanine amidase
MNSLTATTTGPATPPAPDAPPPMSRPAGFLAVLLAAALAVVAPLAAQAVRLPPTRPARFSVTTIDQVAYYSLADLAKHLDLKATWSKDRKAYTLAGKDRKLEFNLEGDGRKLFLDGLWVHLGNKVVTKGGTAFLSVTDYEHTLRGILSAREAGALPPVPQVIVLDPGHGGNDAGNTQNGLVEKTLTLDVANRLKRVLEGQGYRVVLTRTEDKALGPDKAQDLRARSDMTTTVGADLFISIHFNSLSPEENSAEKIAATNGPEVFVFTPAGQRSTSSWTTGKDDTETKPVPANQHDAWSSLLAHNVQGQLLAALKTTDRGQKTSHLGVLRGLDCPGVLVESAFLSNPTEARRVNTPEFRDQIAAAIAAGVEAYAKTIKAVRATQ